MKPVLIILTFLSLWSAHAGNDPISNKTERRTYKLITKARLVHLIDSVFDLDKMSKKDLELLNYYASILKTNNSDTVRVYDLDLRDLNFYSLADEKILFPVSKLSDIPSSSNLIIENGYLSYFCNPFNGVVTSNFGYREGRIHKGIDIDLNKGDKVKAAFSGKVRLARRQGGYGNVVVIMHPNGLETVYAHLSRIKVKSGDVVKSGQVIGLGGNTGHSSGSHLHFELRYKGHALNPGALICFSENRLIHHTITLKHNLNTLTAFPANSYLHQVKRGESWLVIAHQYGLTLKELMTLNGVGRRTYLRPGQQLRVQ